MHCSIVLSICLVMIAMTTAYPRWKTLERQLFGRGVGSFERSTSDEIKDKEEPGSSEEMPISSEYDHMMNEERELFKSLDMDGDGYLTMDEAREHLNGLQDKVGESPDQLFKDVDADGDGRISEEEFLDRAKAEGFKSAEDDNRPNKRLFNKGKSWLNKI